MIEMFLNWSPADKIAAFGLFGAGVVALYKFYKWLKGTKFKLKIVNNCDVHVYNNHNTNKHITNFIAKDNNKEIKNFSFTTKKDGKYIGDCPIEVKAQSIVELSIWCGSLNNQLIKTYPIGSVVPIVYEITDENEKITKIKFDIVLQSQIPIIF